MIQAGPSGIKLWGQISLIEQAGLDSFNVQHPSTNGSELKVAEAGKIIKEYTHNPEAGANADQVLHGEGCRERRTGR